MAQKKSVSVYRTNLVSVGLAQGLRTVAPYLASVSEFDRQGHPILQCTYGADGLLTERMEWEYDEKGRIIKEQYYTEDEEVSEVKTFEFDSNGLVVKEIKHYLDETFDTTTYVYNENHQLVEKITTDDENEVEIRETFGYNGKLLIKHEITDADNNSIALEELTYDEKGKVTGLKRINEETGENFSTVSTWDDKGNRIKLEMFDEVGDLVETIFFEHDENGRLIASRDESDQRNSVTSYTYDERGNNSGHEELDANGDQLVVVEHDFDTENNITGSTVFISGNSRSQGQHYRENYEYEWFDSEE